MTIEEYIQSHTDEAQTIAEDVVEDATADIAAQLLCAAGMNGRTQEAAKEEERLLRDGLPCMGNWELLAAIQAEPTSASRYAKMTGWYQVNFNLLVAAYRRLARKHAEQVTIFDASKLVENVREQCFTRAREATEEEEAAEKVAAEEYEEQLSRT